MAFADAVLVTPISLPVRVATSIETLVAADGTNGNKFVANENTILRVKNAGGAEITVTVVANYTVSGLVVANATFTVPATTGDVLWTGFAALFRQNAAKQIHVTFSAVTSVTIQVIQPQ